MKERILGRWNTMRIVYTLFGLAALFTGIISKDWLVGFIGVVFTGMGIFSFGCAGGNCAPGNSFDYSEAIKKIESAEVVFEEVE